ncbi:peptide chain release factor N(5)-glutamine methyltransferase [Maribacter aestuarii]|uniref:peptide chain release factor N(5)-glutamine methyltransferase n=1 Tax=Maribacter aestuarii TaxID=1130723 RepID=UPI0025A5B17E|nr:peptide chain release factor N(5)-glutamine methyltransferase [Maribacter aestuarii]
MLLAEIKKIFHHELDELYGADEVSSFFYLLIEHYLGLERFILAIQPNLVVSKEDENPLFAALSQLKLQKPIQHIIGHTYFMELKFNVGPDVLIPRPETEDLVRWIMEDYQETNLQNINILDIGTGSGCIPIVLAKNLENAQVAGLDISSKALTIARSNALLNGIEVNFFEGDILKGISSSSIKQKYDIIISNPPYVKELEKEKMSLNVVDYEPNEALFVPDKDPLVFYKAIAEFAQNRLTEGGSLYLEINQYLGKEMVDLLENYTFRNIELRKDVFGNDRMIKAIKV